MFPSYLPQTKNFVHPSLSMISNMAESTTPIMESAEEGGMCESPYIDVSEDPFYCSDADSDSEISLTDHYGQVPRNTLRVSLRHRSRTICDDATGLEAARLTYQQILYGDCKRSNSLPVDLNRNDSYINTDDINIMEWMIQKPRQSTNSSDGGDGVFFPEKKGKTKKQLPRKSFVPKISLKLKLTSVTKQKNNTEDKKERKVSLTDRLKSAVTKKNSFPVSRNRAGTNPFF